jgi:midasin
MWNTLNTQRTTSSREFGLQDLMKFSRRIEKLLPPTSNTMDIDTEQPTLSSVFFNPALKEDVYLEARDVFFGAGTMTAASRAAMEVVASIVGEHLGLDPDRCQWLTDRRTPDFQIETDANGSTTGLLISRTYLPSRKVQSTPFAPSTRPFALHRPAVCLLSRIANAVSHEEPVLLTGETGTGKTSVVTHLASTLRRPLISLNLSQQTESSDLIGGLKPVDARIPGSSLQERFSELFGATFSRKKNEKFETSVRKAVNEGKWKRVAGLWKESVKMAQERYKAKQQSSTR